MFCMKVKINQSKETYQLASTFQDNSSSEILLKKAKRKVSRSYKRERT